MVMQCSATIAIEKRINSQDASDTSSKRGYGVWGVYNGMGLGVRFKWLGVSSGWRAEG